MAGGIRVAVTLRAPDFRLDVERLRAAVSDRTRLILLNTPHNPTGAVLTRDELQAVADLAIERDLLVVTDEVYEHMAYDVAHVPIATLPGMAERTLTISSAGKTFSFTGWKVGWATGPAELVAAVMGVKQFLSYMSGAPLQPAIAHALGSRSAPTIANIAIVQATSWRVDTFVECTCVVTSIEGAVRVLRSAPEKSPVTTGMASS
jgi:N-succinyldiaminopimelate aminotransferase